MVLHNFECSKGHITEQLVETTKENWIKRSCVKCGGEAERVFLPRNHNAQAPAIVVYRDASGHTIYPGRNDAKMPARYAKLGYERVEMNLHEARRFSSQMNREERAKLAVHLEREQAHAEALSAQQRSELRDAMRNMSRQGRDYVRAVMEYNNSQDAKRYYSTDPGFHNEALES